MRASTLLLAGFLLAAGATAAQGQTIAVDKPACVPMEDNGLVHATATGVAPGLIPRLYFRWMEHEDFFNHLVRRSQQFGVIRSSYLVWTLQKARTCSLVGRFR